MKRAPFPRTLDIGVIVFNVAGLGSRQSNFLSLEDHHHCTEDTSFYGAVTSPWRTFSDMVTL